MGCKKWQKTYRLPHDSLLKDFAKQLQIGSNLMNFSKISRWLYTIASITLFIFSIMLIVYGVQSYDWHDFEVFYSAARAAIEGRSIYVIVGQYDLPFWYFPWVAWFFIPLSFWSYEVGLFLYQIASLATALGVLVVLSRYYDPQIRPLTIVLIFGLIAPMSIQLMQVGQMDYILLALIVATIFAVDRKMDILAGLLLPFIWIKPHLVIIFTLFALIRSGKRTILVSSGFVLLMLLLETLLSPGWHLEMLNLLKIGTQRVDGLQFTTFPSLLGFQENWVGTGNLPFTIILLAFAVGATWYFRFLPTVPFLSLALTASLFCAPRAYAYDLPLLIPSMIWLTHGNFKKTAWIWFTVTAIALVSGFGSSSYLATLLVYGLSLWKAYQRKSQLS